MTVRLVHLGIAQLPQLLLQLLHQHFPPAALLDVDELAASVGGVLLQVSDRLGICRPGAEPKTKRHEPEVILTCCN